MKDSSYKPFFPSSPNTSVADLQRNMNEKVLNKSCCSCTHKKGGRNLIVNLDGTGNQFGDRNTNVIELYNLVAKKTTDNQLCWYNSGIGTYARPSWTSLSYLRRVFYHKIDLAIAWNFERTVMGAYRWLSDNYQDGDCIFLFGFSRGAFQVRVLSAMIEKVGLIHKGNEMQIPFAFELYADRKSSEEIVDKAGTSEKTTMAARFKSAFCHEDVKVHFVGAWDTVSSIGVVRGKHLLPGTIDGMKHVCYFRHALALDERRVKFLPEYAYGGSTHPPNGPAKSTTPYSTIQESLTPTCVSSEATIPHTLEVWFAGTHSDIGGGNVQNVGLDRSRPPLRWMVLQATSLGLRIKSTFPRELSSNEQIEVKESLTWAWRPLELMPFKRLTFSGSSIHRQETHGPHLGAGRIIQPGQKLHSSLILSGGLGTSYIPKARFSDASINKVEFWKQLNTSEELIHWVEMDLDTHIEDILRIFVLEETKRETMFNILRQIATWTRQAVYEITINTVKKGTLGKIPLLEAHYEALGQLTTRLDMHEELCKTVGGLLHRLVVQRYQSEKDTLQRIAAFGDGRRAICAVSVNALKTGTLFSISMSLEHRIDLVRKIMEDITMPLAADGTRSVYDELCTQIEDIMRSLLLGDSESLDDLRQYSCNAYGRQAIYDTGIHLLMKEKIEEEIITSDQRYKIMQFLIQILGKNSDVRLVQLADVRYSLTKLLPQNDLHKSSEEFLKHLTTCCTTTIIGHTGVVNAVAFSKEGQRLVSGSYDNTIRIWDVKTGSPIGNPLTGHSDHVFSIAVSPDGKYIVSGSDDDTIRLWDMDTQTQIGEPWTGHNSCVYAVAFSPDGKLVVSGSRDRTVRIWDAETGNQIGEPFTDHDNWVWSVAYSPDSNLIASGSYDSMVRIWDLSTRKRVGAMDHDHGVSSIVFAPNGKLIASGSFDNTVRLWDIETNLQVGEPLRGHTSFVNSVSFSPNGKLVVSGSNDKTIRIWDVESGKQIGGTLRGHSDYIQYVAFSPDGKTVASGSEDNTLRLWDIDDYLQL